MTNWAGFTEEAPELATRAQELLGAHKFLTMATLRQDGAPRISGTEITIAGGEVYLGGMTGAWRFKDLRRDPRVAVHSGPLPEDRWRGDAKLSGRAVELTSPEDFAAFREVHPAPDGDFELFRLQLTEVTVVRLEGDPPEALLIETWHPGRQPRTVRR